MVYNSLVYCIIVYWDNGKQHGKGLLPVNLYCREMLDRRMGWTGADNVRIVLPGLYTCTNSTDNDNNHHDSTTIIN